MADLAQQVADLVAEARDMRLEIEKQARLCRSKRGRRFQGRGAPILYFYLTIFNGAPPVEPVGGPRGVPGTRTPGLAEK